MVLSWLFYFEMNFFNWSLDIDKLVIKVLIRIGWNITIRNHYGVGGRGFIGGGTQICHSYEEGMPRLLQILCWYQWGAQIFLSKMEKHSPSPIMITGWSLMFHSSFVHINITKMVILISLFTSKVNQWKCILKDILSPQRTPSNLK